MALSIEILWIIYILIIVVVFLIFWKLELYPLPTYLIFLIFSIIALSTVIIGGIYLISDNISDSDASSLAVLLIIAFLIPSAIILYIIWNEKNCNECLLNK